MDSNSLAKWLDAIAATQTVSKRAFQVAAGPEADLSGRDFLPVGTGEMTRAQKIRAESGYKCKH